MPEATFCVPAQFLGVLTEKNIVIFPWFLAEKMVASPPKDSHNWWTQEVFTLG